MIAFWLGWLLELFHFLLCSSILFLHTLMNDLAELFANSSGLQFLHALVNRGSFDMKSAQRAMNESSRGAWRSYALHRTQVMSILRACQGDRLSLLGPGNCNDVILSELLGQFSKIDLIDIDEQAVQRAIDLQGLVSDGRLRVHTHDLSGLAAPLEGFDSASPDLSALIKAAELAAPPPVADCDVVVSLCVFTQMVDFVSGQLGDQHPQLTELILALRKAHLEQMIGMLRAGGVGWLVTDIVSTETAPSISGAEVQDLPAKLRQLIQERNFFTGANPFSICSQLQSPPFSQRVADVTCLQPWIWDQAKQKFLCTAIGFRRIAS